jgi:hypothetical protein
MAPMKKRILLGIAVAILCSCSPKGRVELALKLEPGGVHRLRVISAQTVTQTVDAGRTTVSQDTAMTVSFRALSVDPSGRMRVEAVYEALSIGLRGPDMKLDFDSADSGSATAGLAALKGLIGKGFMFSVGSRGEVAEVEGARELMDGIVAASDPAMAQSLRSSLGPFLGEDPLASTLESIFKFFPPGKVAAGDEWYSERRASGAVPFVMRNRWALTGITGKKARLSLLSTVSNLEPRSGVMISGTNEGIMEVDLESGMPVSASFSQKIGGSLVIQGKIVPVEVSAKVRIE